VFQAISDGSVAGLYVADSDGAIVYVNGPGLRMLGYDDAVELIGLDARATLHGAEDIFRRRDGSGLAVAGTSSPLPLATGPGSVVVFRDITAERAAAEERLEAEQLIRQSESLHRTLVANLPDTSVFLLDHELRILVADGEAIRRLSWFDGSMFRGRKVSELYADVPDGALRLSLDTYSAALRGERGNFEFESDGLSFAVQAVPVWDDGGTVESVLVVARDVTEHAEAEQQKARRAGQRHAVAELARFALGSRDLGELMDEAVTTVAATLDVEVTGVLEFDEASETFTVVAAVGLPDGFVGAKQIPLGESGNAGHTMRTGEPTVVENLMSDHRFTLVPSLLELGVASSASVRIENLSRPFGVLNVHTHEPRKFSEDEVTFLTEVATLIIVAVDRGREEEATRHAALHDHLTDLPNRTLALDRLAHALARRSREHIDVAVIALGLDRFKMINDSLGQASGDEVLVALTPRLISAVRTTDTVARVGGDGFVVICPDIDGARGAADVAERIAAAVSRPLSLSSGEHFLSISAGIALSGSPEDTPESLLGDADAAMYRAKDRGRGRYELFDEVMRTSVMARVRMEAELRRALERGELEVWYQPVVDLATGRPTSTEALVRWAHPERGLIMPLDFIPIAEESGLIVALGMQVLEQACAQTAAWQHQLDSPIGVSVNISGRQAINPRFPAQVVAVAERSGIRAGSLALEITESVFMEEADSPVTVLGSFHEMGLALALDDFGTGYSSLSRLKRFPLDALKIDRSFVSGLERNKDDRAIVRATIDMAHAVGLTVVAEGVETSEQAEYLRSCDCDRVQGYLYAWPQPARAMTNVLAATLR
jgi:diguanylate cyclase (GGDEF)-like protein